MQQGVDWGGNYSRFSFDELKRYLMMLKEQGVPVLDDEFNLLQEILLTAIRRVVIDSFGDGSVNNGFLLVGTGAINNFTIKGGDGSANGAGRLYVSGYPVVLAADTTYASQPLPQAALTTPAVARTDEVYIDAWLDEIDTIDDPAIIDSAIGIETSRRLKLFWRVKVAEGSTTPAAFVDSNGLPHFILRLAKINRTATAAIDAGMVVDLRNSNRSTDARIDHVITEAAIGLNKNDKTQLKAAILTLTGTGVGNDIMSVTSTSSPVALTAASPDRILIDASLGGVIINLPAANNPALRFTFMRTDTSVNTVTINRAGTDTIEGVASWPVNVGGRFTLVNDKISQWTRANIEVATAAEVQAGAITQKAVTPNLLVASQTARGILEIATDIEVAAGTDNTRAVTPLGLKSVMDGLQSGLGFTPVQQGGGVGQLTNKVKIGAKNGGLVGLTVDADDKGDIMFSSSVATTTAKGPVELADTNETLVGTDNTRAVTPLGLSSAWEPKLSAKQNNLNFTPVQEGGGVGQVPGKIKIGSKGVGTIGLTVGENGDKGDIMFSTSVANESVVGPVRFATTTETQAGTSASQAVSPKGLHSLQKSLAPTGYSNLPGGLIVQWGANTVSANTTATVDLPIAFPAKFAAGAASVENAGASSTGDVFVTRLSLSQLQLVNSRGSVSLAHWFAIGY